MAKKKQKWERPPLDSPELAHISPDLRQLATPVEFLVQDPANVRMHPERNMQAVASSLSQFGQRKNIVVNRKGFVTEAGNGTLEAAQALGWKWIAASFEDDDHTTATAYAIADNRTAELAVWDYENLTAQLDALAKDGIGTDSLGFSDQEYEALANQFQPPPAQDPEAIPGYVEEQDTFSIRVEGVKPEEKDDVLEALRAALGGWDHLSAEAY